MRPGTYTRAWRRYCWLYSILRRREATLAEKVEVRGRLKQIRRLLLEEQEASKASTAKE